MERLDSDLVFGFHAVTSTLRLHPDQVREIWIDKSRADERTQLVLDVARGRNILVHHVPRSELDKMAGASKHQGVIAHCASGATLAESDLKPVLASLGRQAFFLVLDGVQDPHNLGACLRSAEAAGVNGVIIPKDRAAGITATVRKTASGAVDSVLIYRVTNLARTLNELRAAGVWLIGLDASASVSLFAANLSGPLALVLGAEERGLRRLTRERCDELVRLPMFGQVESLNVSVATGICLYEVVRQRGCDQKLN